MIPMPASAEGGASRVAGRRWVVGVALAGGFLAGSCTGAASETGAGVAGLLSAATALTTGILYRLLPGNNQDDMPIYGITGTASAAAAWFLPFIILGIVSLAISVAGGIAAAMTARWWQDAGKGAAWLIGAIAALASLTAAIAVTIAYWEACDPRIISGCTRQPAFHHIGFGLAAGALPALAGAITAQSAKYICRWDDARRGRRRS